MPAIVPVAAPGNKKSTHHLVLTQGATKVGLILCDSEGNAFSRAFHRRPMPGSALKMSTGLAKYSDMMPPWTPISQEDWDGGKGAKDYDKDTTMYFDSEKVNTTRAGEIILAGKPTDTSFANVNMTNTDSGSTDSVGVGASETKIFAWKFTASESFTPTLVSIVDAIADVTLRVGLCPIAAGVPDTANIAWSTETQTNGAGLNTQIFSLTKALTSGTAYCLLFKLVGSAFGYSHVVWYHNGSAAADDYWTSTDLGVNWVAGTDDVCPFFLIYTNPDKLCRARFFQYKGALYVVKQNDDATGNKLWLNGDQGVCETTGTTSTVVKTHSGMATWAAGTGIGTGAVGCIFKIVSGKGSDQPQNWRTITLNDATSGTPIAGSFTVSPAWDVLPDDTSIFVIQASDKWTEITVTLGQITDVLVANGAVYLAGGDDTDIIRFTARDASGTWTYEFSNVTTAETGHFTYLIDGADSFGEFILGAKGGYPAQTQRAPAVDWSAGTGAAALTWETAQSVGNLYERITGLVRYGEYGDPHAFKEGSLHHYTAGKWLMLSNPAMMSTSDTRTGRAFCVQEPYLYYSYQDRLVRYYNGYADGVGPDKAEVAIPTGNRYGNFTCLRVYPGLVIGSVDAGASGYSTVIAYNERGWCELYRAALGYRIQELFVQSIEGQAVDRLWISEGSKFVWIPLSIDPINHPSDGYNPYKFCNDGNLTTAWNYLGKHGIDKLFNSIRLVGENLSATCYVTVAYQVDSEDATNTWHTIATTVTTFSQELDLAATPSVYGKRIRFRFSLHSDTGLVSPRIIASVLEALEIYPVKYITDIRFRVGDKDMDLLKQADKYPDHDDKLNALEGLIAIATPPLVESVSTQLHNKYCRIDAINVDPHSIELETGKEVYIGTAQLVEIS